MLLIKLKACMELLRMGIKITGIILLLAICSFFCGKKAETGTANKNDAVKYDTIWMGLEKTRAKYSQLFLVPGARAFERGVELKTKSQGNEESIDTVYYFHRVGDKFVAVAGLGEGWRMLLYYNGDSLAVNVAGGSGVMTVNEYVSSKFTVFCVVEKRWLWGKFVIFKGYYKMDNNGILDKVRNYTSTRLKKGFYDTTIISRLKGDSVIIYKNGRIDYVYK